MVGSGEQMTRVRHFLCSPTAIVLAALAIRVVATLTFYGGLPLDSYSAQFGEMPLIAKSIAEGKGFSSPFPAETGPTAWTPPIYPYLLGFIYKMFGVFTHRAHLVAIFLNCIFAALTVIPVTRIARRAFGATTACASGWLWAVYPMIVYMPVKWLWETSLSTLLFLLGVELAFQIRESAESKGWVWFGILGGLCALTNTATVAPLALLAIWAFLGLRNQGKKWFRPALLSAVIGGALLAPWLIRNYITFGQFVGPRSNFGVEFYIGNNKEAADAWAFWVHPAGSPDELERYKRIGEIAYNEEKTQEALQFIRQNPKRFVMLTLNRMVYFWTGSWDSLNDIWASGVSLYAFNVTGYALIGFLGLTGLLFANRENIPAAGPLSLILLAYPLVYYVTHPAMRYRHPIDSILTILTIHSVVFISARVMNYFRK